MTVSPDRTQISYVAANNAGPIPHDLFFQSVAGGAPHDVTASIDRPVLGLKWQSDSTAVISIADGFRFRLYRLVGKGTPTITELPYPNGGPNFAIAHDGTVAFVAIGFSRLQELFLQPEKGPATQVSHVQEGRDGITLADVREDLSDLDVFKSER